MSQLGERIRTARIEAGLSQDQLGAKIGLTGKTIRRYEKGETTPDSSSVAEIADVTERPLAFFLPNVPAEEDATTGPKEPEDGPPAALSPAYHANPSETVSIPIVTIQGPELVDTGNSQSVPRRLVHRLQRKPDRLRLLPIPRRHYALLRYLEPSDTLVLDPLEHPLPFDALLERGDFVDGQYVVGIGHACLQVKTVTSHPDDTITIESVDGTQRFRYEPTETSGVAIHAAVAMCY